MCGAPPTGNSVSHAENTSGFLSFTLDNISSVLEPRRVAIFHVRMLLMLLHVGAVRAFVALALLGFVVVW